jgi:hypothetical protein
MLRVLIAAVAGAFRVSATAATGVTKDTSIGASVPVGDLSRVAWTGRCPKATSAAKKQSNRFRFPIGCTNEMISVRVFLSAIHSPKLATYYVMTRSLESFMELYRSPRSCRFNVSRFFSSRGQFIAVDCLFDTPSMPKISKLSCFCLLVLDAAVNGVKRPGRLELLVLYVRGC